MKDIMWSYGVHINKVLLNIYIYDNNIIDLCIYLQAVEMVAIATVIMVESFESGLCALLSRLQVILH